MKFLILAALLALTLPGELDAAVKSCYQCTLADKGCGDPFNSNDLKPSSCKIASDSCMKTKADGKVIRRSCAPKCIPVSGNDDNNVSCCKTDDCNAGMMTSFSIIVMMTSLLMAYLAKGRF